MPSAERVTVQLDSLVQGIAKLYPGSISLGTPRVQDVPTSTLHTGIMDLGNMIRPTHYEEEDVGENHSPHETIVSSTNVSEAEGQVRQHQSIEKFTERLEKAHLVDKVLCLKHGLEALNSDDNNYLALSPNMHTWFDPVHNSKPGSASVAIKVAEVHKARSPGQLDRVDLQVIPRSDSLDAQRYLPFAMKDPVFDGSDAGYACYRTHVNVLDAELFCVCITWKYNKTVQGWHADGKLPENVHAVPTYNFEMLQTRFGPHSLQQC
jgi:hypothetical protein